MKQATAPTVLITRAEPDALRLADELRNRWGCGVGVVLSPLLEMVPVGDMPDIRGMAGLIFTSRYAVEIFARLSPRRDLPCYAVGPATAAAARDSGFTVRQADGDAPALVALIKKDRPGGPLLHLRGAHMAYDIAGALNEAGVPTSEAVLYKQRAGRLSDEARLLLAGTAPVILPLYSPRSAAILFEQIHPSAPLLIAAISANVAGNVPEGVALMLRTAQNPDADAMLAELDVLYHEANRLESANRAQ